VNATGVWADEVRARGGDAHPTIQPAKGVHVTVPAARLPLDVAAVIPVAGDGRSIFVIPWPGDGLVYIGTTDTAYKGPLGNPRSTSEDVDYLLGAVNRVTMAPLSPTDVTAVWAGLRPLLAPAAGRRVAPRTADLSRRHRVAVEANGVVTVTGGKLTTYRKMAQDAVDTVSAQLSGPRRSRRR
jgi:glycerol-3-phosphate dehydrogenase